MRSPDTKLVTNGVLFDLDGTLVDSLALTFAAFNHAITQFGVGPYTPQEFMPYMGPGEREIFAKIVGQENSYAAYQASREYLDANLEKVPLHPGIDALLDQLKSASIPIGIVTGRSWLTSEIILKHHKILDRFVHVIAYDHVSSPKPSPEGVRLCLSKMNLQPEQAVYVGDSPMDMLAGKRAGTKAIAALWDLLADREALSAHSPDFFAKAPREVWDFVRS